MSLASRSRCYEIPSWAIARSGAARMDTTASRMRGEGEGASASHTGGTMGVILTGLWHAIVVNPLKSVKAMVTGKK